MSSISGGGFNLIQQNSFKTKELNIHMAGKATKADQDKVLDLTNLTDISTQDVNKAQYLKVKSGNEDVFLSLEKIPPNDRPAFIASLKNTILGAKDLPDFNLSEFVKFTDDNLQVGKAVKDVQVTLNGEVLKPQDVLKSSNDAAKGTNPSNSDKWFNWANGGREELNSEEVPEKERLKIGREDKPADWYNFISVTPEGNVKVHTNGKSTQKPPGEITKTDVQELIKANLNFNSDISDIKNIAGQIGKKPEEVFLMALQSNNEIAAAFKDNPVLLKELSSEIYSYATKGHGTDGNIDIGKLQGALKLLHPHIDATASSNTNFEITGDTRIPKGDGKLGRATMLEMRHLLANIDFKGINLEPVNLGVEKPEDNTIINIPKDTDVVVFADRSGSMTSFKKDIKDQSAELKKQAEKVGSTFSYADKFNRGDNEQALAVALAFLNNPNKNSFVDTKINLDNRKPDTKPPLQLTFISDRHDNTALSRNQLEELMNLMHSKNIDIVINNPRTGKEINMKDLIDLVAVNPNAKKLKIDHAKFDAVFGPGSKVDYNKLLEPQIKQYIDAELAKGVQPEQVKFQTEQMWFGKESVNSASEDLNNKFWKKNYNL